MRGAKLIPPDGFDLEDPLWTIAAGSVNGTYIANYESKWKNEFVQFITQYSADCCIIQAPHTCRPWTLTTREFAKRVDEELGDPVHSA